MKETPFFNFNDGRDGFIASIALLTQVLEGNGKIFNGKGQIVAFTAEDKTSRYHIGQGVYLMPDEELNKKIPHMSDFGYLYKNNVKLSNIAFRRGGLFSGFKDQQYCDIIAYPGIYNKKPDTMGEHVIINVNGEIVLKSKSFFDHPWFHKGVIGSIKNVYYNLKTGKEIVYANKTVNSNNYLFAENPYSFGEYAKYEQGVYKIEYATGNYEIIK